jgi:lipopolysaccharide/colanic/teichoic acid biosynthesis glycosyltransferase
MRKMVSLILILTTFPLMGILLMFSLLLQGRPIFFLQERIGYKKKPFCLYKLRTMEAGKVTFYGKLLRKTGLDELPQLVNILRGEMKFIGPRPLTANDIERLGWNKKEHHIRWTVLPGLTGPAQISPICTKENSWKLDEAYCVFHSWRTNIKIIILSFFRFVRGKSEVR